MTLTEKIQQMERVDALIRRKSTGSPASLAARLNTSERYVYKLIKLMKNLGAPIYFNYERNSYCYEEEVIFSVGFKLTNDVAQGVRGGKSYSFLPLHDSCSASPYLYIENVFKGYSPNPLNAEI